MNQDSYKFTSALKSLLLYEKNNHIRNGLYDLLQAQLSYHSNSVEGSTLSYDNTWELYDKGEVFSENVVKAQDITDAQGHFLMFDEMLEHLDEPLTEAHICSWHAALKSSSYTDKKNGFTIGEYKKLENSIGGTYPNSLR